MQLNRQSWPRYLVRAGLLFAAIAVLAYTPPSLAQRYVAPAPERAKVHVELSALYFQYGRINIAIEEVEKAIEIDRNYAPAYAMRGLIYGSIKQMKRADADFRLALDKAPNNPEINNNYGWFLCQTNLAERAFTYFERAYNNPLYETPGIAYANAGDCAAKQGDYGRAEELLLRSLRVSRDGGGLAKFFLAKLYLTQNRLTEAKSRIDEAMEALNPPTSELIWLASRIEKALNNPVGERMLIERLKSEFPDSTEYKDYLEGNY